MITFHQTTACNCRYCKPTKWTAQEKFLGAFVALHVALLAVGLIASVVAK